MLLGEKLREFNLKNVVVLGIPRGGVIVAREIADKLKCPLDIILVHKIGAMHHQEMAIGAIDENGKIMLNHQLAAQTGADKAYLEGEKQKQISQINRRKDRFRKIHPKVSLQGKTVILTDDGVATGATMQAAIWLVKEENPSWVIVALPVGPPESLEPLADQADQVLCLRVSDSFYAVSQFYTCFDQISDEEVEKTLSY